MTKEEKIAELVNLTEEQDRIRARINASDLSVEAKDILRLCNRKCRFRHCFDGSDAVKDQARLEQVEKEINESGIATIRFVDDRMDRSHRPEVTFHPDSLPE